MRTLPGGSMLSVSLSMEEIASYLNADIQLAAVNAHNMCVVAGPDNAIDQLINILDNSNIRNRKLHTSHAFHSNMMNPIVDEYQKFVAEIELNTPTLPIYSTVTSEIITDEMSCASYWAHICENQYCLREQLANC
jgi:acyl transferase domain-containing protein